VLIGQQSLAFRDLGKRSARKNADSHIDERNSVLQVSYVFDALQHRSLGFSRGSEHVEVGRSDIVPSEQIVTINDVLEPERFSQLPKRRIRGRIGTDLC